MLDQIKTTMKEIATEFADTRLQLCQLEVVGLVGQTCTLSGQVLDQLTLDSVTGRLVADWPGITWEAELVQVLRQASTPSRTVATNLTGLHAQPSFSSELVSQLFNGWSLEILSEQASWSFVRQVDGYLGWVYRSYLAATAELTPTHLVAAPTGLLRAEPADDEELLTRILSGTAVHCLSQQGGWSQLQLAGGQVGWLPTGQLRPLASLPGTEAERRQQIVEDGFKFTGVPYLWGGCSALGIDCSGLAQLLHRLAGVTLPRDADMQFKAGRPVEEPFRPGDLLFFGRDGERRVISHVAISLGGWRILHASRALNGVYADDVQTNSSLKERFAGARTFLGLSTTG